MTTFQVRMFGALSIAVLALSACSVSGDSASRTKNAALTTTSSSTLPLVKCVDLSNCKIGEAGPGGGRIFRMSFGTYVELAPAGWSGSVRDPLVYVNDAIRLASEYRGGGLSDWTIFTSADFHNLCRLAYGQKADSDASCVFNQASFDSQFGNGTGDSGSSMYWYKDGTSVKGKFDVLNDSTREYTQGVAFVRPVRAFRFVPPTTTTTTTTIPATCAQGGKCSSGDISPAGNLIVDVQGSGQDIQYLEIAPKEWKEAGISDPSATRAGSESAIAKYQGGSSSDWRLPTIAEMRAAFVFFNEPKFDNDCRDTSTSSRGLTTAQSRFSLGGTAYWVIDASARGKFVAFDVSSGAVYFNANSYETAWGTKTDGTVTKRYARPVRTVKYTGPAMTVTPYVYSPSRCKDVSAPTTAPPTTVAVNCAGRGRCSVGDIGPNGGIIIAVNRNTVDGPEYTEMAKPVGKNLDCAGTFNPAVKCTKRNWFDGSYSAPFGEYPTIDELKTIAKSKSLMASLQLRKDYYWTNKYKSAVTMVEGDFTGNLNDLGRSISTSSVASAYVVNLSNGKDITATSAYFRGVTRWKCQAACVGW